MYLLSLNTQTWQMRELATLLQKKEVSISIAKAEKKSLMNLWLQICMVANPKYYYNCPNSEQRHTVAYIWTELRITTEQCVSNKEFRINVHPSIFLNKSRYEIIHSALTVCQNSDYNTAAVGSNTMHLFRFMLMYLLYPEEFYRIT